MDLTMLRKLAQGEHPYDGGPFAADHIKLFRDDARRLVFEIERLRAIERRARAARRGNAELSDDEEGGWLDCARHILDGEAAHDPGCPGVSPEEEIPVENLAPGAVPNFGPPPSPQYAVIPAYGAVKDEVVHDCPRDDEAVTLCCGRSPFELPRTDRMTVDQSLVTCTGERR